MAQQHESQNRRLGDFEIFRETGRGGMGVVYEARQLSLNRKLALKVLSGGLGLTPRAVQRFHREAEAAPGPPMIFVAAFALAWVRAFDRLR